MITLILGISLWVLAHFFKRILPAHREAMNTKLGAKGARGIMSVLIIISVVLMVIGYRSWDAPSLYTPIGFLFPIAMLGLISAVALLGLGKSKSRLRNTFRHPMLLGVIVWSCSHLMIRGDWASITLFGGMIIWAVISIFLINKQEGAWNPKEVATSSKGDIRLAIITAVLVIVIMFIHHLIIH